MCYTLAYVAGMQPIQLRMHGRVKESAATYARENRMPKTHPPPKVPSSIIPNCGFISIRTDNLLSSGNYCCFLVNFLLGGKVAVCQTN